MRRLRFLLLCLCAWFFLFYNIERLSEPINLASFVYVFLFGAAAATILIPPFYEWPLYKPLLLTLPLFFLLKVQLEYPILGDNLPITVTEIFAILMTLVITRYIMQRMAGLQETIAHLTMGHLRQDIPFDVGQGLIYRELRRARYHERPLTLLSIVPTQESVKLNLNRFFQEAQDEIIHRYIDARVADLLLKELDDYNIVTQRNGHFIALLTEAEQEEVSEIVARLGDSASEKLGLQFAIGLSHFPDEAVTLEQLLNKAERKMADSLARTKNTATATEEGEERPTGETQPILPMET